MTTWSVVFLGVMAVALVAMAAAQVVLALHASRLARQASETIESIRRDVRPLIEKAHRVTDEAARATAMAAAQVQRLDRLMQVTTERVDETLGIVQHAILQPVRQGAAVVAGIRAAIDVLRGWRARSRQAHDDDEALFVG